MRAHTGSPVSGRQSDTSSFSRPRLRTLVIKSMNCKPNKKISIVIIVLWISFQSILQKIIFWIKITLHPCCIGSGSDKIISHINMLSGLEIWVWALVNLAHILTAILTFLHTFLHILHFTCIFASFLFTNLKSRVCAWALNSLWLRRGWTGAGRKK